MPETRVGLLAMLVLIAGCASAPPPPPPPPPPVVILPDPMTVREIDAATTFIQLEDRREYVSEFFAAAAAAPEPSIRARAALAAGRIAAPPSREFVRNLLSDPDTMVAASAAFAAGLLRDTTAVPLLAALLDSLGVATRPFVAAEAAEALGRIAAPEARAFLTAFLLAADTTATTDPVIDAALIAAWRSGETSVEPFSRWLHSSSDATRWRATYGLVRRARPEAVSVVLPMLSDPDARARAYALRGLTRPMVEGAGRATAEILPQILGRLRDPEYIVRIEAIRVLGSYPVPEVVDSLVSLARSGDSHQQVIALEALGLMGSNAPASALGPIREIAFQVDLPEFIRETAVNSLS